MSVSLSPPATRIRLSVQGMTCAGCTARIETSLIRHPAIQSASASLTTNSVDVAYDDTRLTPAQLANQIEQTGYAASADTIRLAVRGMTCAGCVKRIEDSLTAIPGVLECSVHLTQDLAQVRALEGQVQTDDLVRRIGELGYTAHLLNPQTRQDTAEFSPVPWLLILSVLLTLPFAIHMFGMLTNIKTIALSGWLQFALATPVQFVVGAPFYRSAWNGLRHRIGNMDQLVVLGTSAAYGLSSYQLLIGDAGTLYFESAAMIVTLVLLGRWLESRARQRTIASVRALSTLQPPSAQVIRDGEVLSLAIDEIRIGDQLLVKPGERIAADGIVVEGTSEVDESHLTGESVPVAKAVDDHVFAGAINSDGLLKVRVQAIGAQSSLARIIDLIESAQSSKAPVQRLVDQICAFFVPLVMIIAGLTAVGWLMFNGDLANALITAATVLVIACPCALGLATPAAIIVGTGVAARHGILIKDASSLEIAHSLTTIAFDKTGTLTAGAPVIVDVVSVEGNPHQLLELAASAQSGSEHPIAKAFVNEARKLGIPLSTATQLERIPGEGVKAAVTGRELQIGNRRLMRRHNVDLTTHNKTMKSWEESGYTVIALAETTREPTLLGLVAISDELKVGAIEAVDQLHALNIKTVILSGDNTSTVDAVAQKVGVQEAKADLLPNDKVRYIADLQKHGETVAMVGDGVNDAPALAQANVGFAMATGSDVSLESAPITLMKPDPRSIGDAIEVSQATYRKIRQNLFWAFVYNVIGIPLAAFGILTPVVAGAAMSISSLCVVTNALLLKRWQPHRRGWS